MICESFDSASRFARPCYYSTSVSLCQEVFENFFWKFFAAFCLGRKCLDIISHSLPFVKRFFKSFFNFFRDILCAVFLSFSAARRPLVDSLHIIALSFSFVKGVFISFFGLDVRALIHKSTDVLCAYCTKSSLSSFFPPLFEGANFLFSSPRAHLVKNPPPKRRGI